MLSQGVPMLLAGDEIGRTQRGNNNAYCQDNEISWLDWAARGRRAAAVHPRRRSPCGATIPVFRRRRWFHGRAHPRQRGAPTSRGSPPTESR